MAGKTTTMSVNLDADRNKFDSDNEKKEENQIRIASFRSLNKLGTKKLLVLDLNGLLIHRAHRGNKSEIPQNRSPDGVYNKRLVYRRPFLEEFLKFCLEVGIWSSSKESNVNGILECAFKELRSCFLFVWDQKSCSDSGFKSLENIYKTIYFKELKNIWGTLALSKGGLLFSESNTLLIDDEPYKRLLNPPNTGVYPRSYDAGNLSDDVLDPKKELCLFLEGLANAEDVPSYVAAHPFGQPAIGPQHPMWGFYSTFLRRLPCTAVQEQLALV